MYKMTESEFLMSEIFKNNISHSCANEGMGDVFYAVGVAFTKSAVV